MNLIFTCGGTAGHINPAIAIANEMRRRDPNCKVLFIGAVGHMEEKLVPQAGYELRTLPGSGLSRKKSLAGLKQNIHAVNCVLQAVSACKKIFREFQPDTVIGTGGYASFPALYAGSKMGIPTCVHESNAVPGLTTKALSKVVDRVMVGFEESRSHYDDPSKVVVTGTPVRGDFFKYTRQEAREKLGLADERPLLLSYWGSLGAEVMNQKMVDFIAKECYEGAPYRHIHAAGRDFAWMKEELLRRGLQLGDNGIEVREYIYDMALVMRAADLVVSRAGASTLSELAALGVPAVLVPSPNVTNDHQTKNARALEEAGIRLHTIPSAELSRGRGGPRCMSMPLWREDP